MNVTYGIKIAPKDDRYITIAEKALAGMAEAANPGAFLVDLLPFSKLTKYGLFGKTELIALLSEIHSVRSNNSPVIPY